jgi:hypothetical protein
MRWLLIVFAFVLASPTEAARMYQWLDANSGNPELSGTPPPWYRGPAGGPRVQVFENGSLVDDTAIRLSPSQSEELREAAFEAFERQRETEAVKRLERAARREAAHKEQRERTTVAESGQPATPEGTSDSSEEIPENLDQPMIDRLKDIIQAWDSRPGTAPQ